MSRAALPAKFLLAMTLLCSGSNVAIPAAIEIMSNLQGGSQFNSQELTEKELAELIALAPEDFSRGAYSNNLLQMIISSQGFNKLAEGIPKDYVFSVAYTIKLEDGNLLQLGFTNVPVIAQPSAYPEGLEFQLWGTVLDPQGTNILDLGIVDGDEKQYGVRINEFDKMVFFDIEGQTVDPDTIFDRIGNATITEILVESQQLTRTPGEFYSANAISTIIRLGGAGINLLDIRELNTCTEMVGVTLNAQARGEVVNSETVTAGIEGDPFYGLEIENRDGMTIIIENGQETARFNDPQQAIFNQFEDACN